MSLFTESEASWEEWWTYDGISGENRFLFSNIVINSLSGDDGVSIDPFNYL